MNTYIYEYPVKSIVLFSYPLIQFIGGFERHVGVSAGHGALGLGALGVRVVLHRQLC